MELIELIKQFEGFRSRAYLCPSKVWTIGYGNTFYLDGSKVKQGDTITEKDATILLQKTLSDFRLNVLKIVPATLPNTAVDALVSFAYNCGVTALKNSTLLKKIKENPLNLKGIEKEFAKWNKGGGKVLQGLVKRRKLEFEMYEDGILNQYTKKELLYKTPPKE